MSTFRQQPGQPEGVPLGAKIVRLACKNAKKGEYVIVETGLPIPCLTGWPYGVQVVVAPADDNHYGKFLHEVEADIRAAGWEPMDGEDYFREPKPEEWFWEISGKEFQCVRTNLSLRFSPRIILKPLKPKTRLVLVQEHEIVDGQQVKQGIQYVTKSSAEKLVKEYPARYRIEEREC